MCIRQTITALMLASVAMLGVTAAQADNNWRHHHPRRAQVNHRIVHQNQRIRREVREGEMSRGEAHRLHRNDRMIRHEERIDARANGGHITPAQQQHLNQELNANSRAIGH